MADGIGLPWTEAEAMQNDEAKATVESVPGTTGKAPAKPKGLLQGESGGMILLTGAILGCVLIAWGFQRNAKRKIAATETEYGELLRPRAESGPLTSYNTTRPTSATARAAQATHTQHAVQSQPAAERAGVRNQAELAADVSEIATLRQDLREVGQKAVKELDARLEVLESAILRAETLVQRLEAATRNAEVGATSPSSMVFPSAPVFTPPNAPRTESYVEARPAMPVARAGRDDTRTIIELAEQGMSAREIAQQVGRPIGQVELIIALRGKGATARS
jgi:hypothetical protein